jgi:hypothetical protein
MDKLYFIGKCRQPAATPSGQVKIDGCNGTNNDTDHEPGEESNTKRPRLDKSYVVDGVDQESCRRCDIERVAFSGQTL